MPVLDKKNQEDMQRYNKFVRDSAFGVATQDLAWGKVKEDWDTCQVYMEREGQIVAAMSILFKKTPLGKTLAYAPRGPVCDPTNYELIKALVKDAEPLLKSRNAFLLRFDPEIEYSKEIETEYKKMGAVVRGQNVDAKELIQPRYNMILDTENKTFDDLMGEFSSKTRYNIRLSERKGVTTRYSNKTEDLKIFYNIHQITAKRDKISIRAFDYYEKLIKAFGENSARIYIASHEGDDLSAAIAIKYGKKMWYIYGASSNHKRNLMPNYQMQKAMIEWGLEENCSLYDFGGVFVLDSGNGLYRFKEGFCREKGVTEFIGEIDFVYSKFVYWLFIKVVPLMKKVRSKLSI